MAVVERRLAASVNAATYERVKFEADKEKRSVSNWLRALVEQHFESTDANPSGENREPSPSSD